MTGLVLELQRNALDKSVDVTDLLRKAKVVSKKLGIVETEGWIELELSGYPDDESTIPYYREISGTLRAHNPYHGWQPLHFECADLAESLSVRKIDKL